MNESARPGTDEDVAAELRRTNTVRLVWSGTFLLPGAAALAIFATAEISVAAWIVAVDVLLRVFNLVMSQWLIRRDDAKAVADGPGSARQLLRQSGEKAAKALANPAWSRDLRLPATYLIMVALSSVAARGRSTLVLEVCVALVVAGAIEILLGRTLTGRMSARALAVAGPVIDAEVREIASRVLATDGRDEAIGYVTYARRCHIDEAMTVVDSLTPSKRYTS